MWNHKGGFLRGNGKYAEPILLLLALKSFPEPGVFQINEFTWNQIKNFMCPLPISSMHGFFGGGVDCAFKGLEALECELWITLQWFTIAWESQDEKSNYFWVIITSSYDKATHSKFTSDDTWQWGKRVKTMEQRLKTFDRCQVQTKWQNSTPFVYLIWRKIGCSRCFWHKTCS